jgi:hypothetical protein
MNSGENKIKFASYYTIKRDTHDDIIVKYYDREGNKLDNIFISSKQIKKIGDVNEYLNQRLDPNDINMIRPATIKIYESSGRRTIGFFDKNNYLFYFTEYSGSDSIYDIVKLKNKISGQIGAPIDTKYLLDTQKVEIINYYDSFSRYFCKSMRGIQKQLVDTISDILEYHKLK